MKLDPMIKMIVARRHVGDSNLTVIKYVVSRLKAGYQTYAELPTRKRRSMMKQIIGAHAANRKLYARVMG